MSDERRLVAAARAGDEDAFTALYQAHAAYVRAVGRPILRRDELEDMCQETFLLAFSRLDSFGGNAGFRTWITRIAINRCLNILRRGRQGSNGDKQLVQMDFEAAEDDILFRTQDVSLDGVPARVDAERLLRRLPPVQRQIVIMAYCEERPAAEIAELLGMNVTAVRSLLYRARLRMQKDCE